MTQAFNLSQLANKVNTSGQLDASTGLYNQVPVANGGTGRSSVTSGRLLVGAGTSAMTELAGSAPGDAVTWNGTAWVAGSVGGIMPVVDTFVAPGTWTKPASIKGIKVIVIGGGGNGGGVPSPATNGTGAGGGGGGAAIEWIPAPSIPGPVAITAGTGTNSFGAFCSATAGANGAVGGAIANGAAGGSGSGGSINFEGGGGGAAQGPGQAGTGIGGSSIMGGGGAARVAAGTTSSAGDAGGNRGGGGSGGAKTSLPGTPVAGGTGAPGIVIVEEFY